MRVIGLIFSKLTLIALLALLQAAAFLACLTCFRRFAAYYLVASFALSAVCFLLVIALINRRANPDHTVLQASIILAAPLAGVAIYVMFLQNASRLKRIKKYAQIHKSTADYLPKNQASQNAQNAQNALKNEDKLLFTQSEYLFRTGLLPLYYGDTLTKYYPSGESFFRALKQEIATAERFIFLEIFAVKKGVMWDEILSLLLKKVEEGVEVRFMYDAVGSMRYVCGGYYKKLRKSGIKCVKFKKFLPVTKRAGNSRDHRKIVVIDGITAFTTGANFTDEYINAVQKFGHWKDCALMLKGGAVKSLTALFLEGYNAQTGTDEDFAPFLPDFKYNAKNLGYVQPFGGAPLRFSPEKTAQNAIINLMSHAQNYVYITTPYLIIDYQLTEAIKQTAKRGVDVRIVTPRIPDKKLIFLLTRSAYQGLMQAGVKIFEYSAGFMHSKNILCDGKTAITGTINLDYRSLSCDFECGVWLCGTPAVAEIETDFQGIFAASHEITPQESRLKLLPKLAKNVLQLFTPLL